MMREIRDRTSIKQIVEVYIISSHMFTVLKKLKIIKKAYSLIRRGIGGVIFSIIWFFQKGRKTRIVVYTAIFGDSDDLLSPRWPFRKIPFVDYVCFTDDETLKSRVWDVKVVETQQCVSARLRAKEYKILPNKHFSHYEYSIWVDGNRRLSRDPRQLILKYLKENNLALFSHHATDCCYEEGERCKAQAKDYTERIDAQLEKYKK